MRAVQAAACVFMLTAAGVCGQMSLSVRPDALWLANDGAHDVVLGSVIQVFCVASGIGSGDVMWTRDGSLLRNDPPHVRIRVTSGDGGAVVSTLTVDNFRSTDGGNYVCKTNSSRSSELQLTAAVTSTLKLTKQPADNERNGNNPLFNLNNDYLFNNRTALPTQVVQVDPDNTPEATRLMQCIATQVGGAGAPNVTWVKDGVDVQPSDRILISSDSTGNRTVSFITISDFGTSDAGVYQCVCTSADGMELLTSYPYRLDYGDVLYLDRVTPGVVVIDPPEKLVLEVAASGGYLRVNWERDGEDFSLASDAIFPASSERFVNFWDTYVRDPTDSDDLGLYRVELVQMGRQDKRNAGDVSFSVFPYEAPRTTTHSETTITAVEGNTIEMSCISEGIPTPTITWRQNGVAMPLSPTEETTDPSIDPLTFAMTSGRITSTLRVPALAYPNSEGLYECVGSNEHGGQERSTTGSFTVQVHVLPEVSMSADPHPNVLPGQSVTISCVVTRGDPSYVTYTWTFHNQVGEVTALADQTSNTLVVANVQVEDYGTYYCTTTNNAGRATTGMIIGEGVKPAVQVSDTDKTTVAYAGGGLTLAVNITNFNIPITVTWTRDGVELANDIDNVVILHTGLDTPPASSTLVVNALRASDSGRYQVTARNPAGQSMAEFEVSVYDTTSALFQVKLILDLPTTFDSCSDWLESSQDVTEEIVSKLVSVVKDQCKCSFGIFQEQISCGSKESSKAAVVFRAQLIRTSPTGDDSASELVDHIRAWVARAESFEVASATATVDQSCKTSFVFFSSEDCEEEEDSESEESSALLDDPTEKLLAGVLLGMCVLLLLTTCVLCMVVVVVCRRKSTSKLWLAPAEKLKLHDYPPTVFPPRAPEPTPLKTMSHGFPNTMTTSPRTTLPRESQPAHGYPTTVVSTAAGPWPEYDAEYTYEVPAEVSMPGNTSFTSYSDPHLLSLPPDTASEGYYSVPRDGCYSVPRTAIFVVKCGGGSHDIVDVDEDVPDDYDNPRSCTNHQS